MRASAGFREIRDEKPQNMAVFSCFRFSYGCRKRNSVVESTGGEVHPALLSSVSNALDSANLLRKGNGDVNTSTGPCSTRARVRFEREGEVPPEPIEV